MPLSLGIFRLLRLKLTLGILRMLGVRDDDDTTRRGLNRAMNYSAAHPSAPVSEADRQQSAQYSGRALAALAQLDADGAIADCHVALALDPHNIDAYLIRGLSSIEKRDYATADADFTNAYRLDPNASRPVSNLAWLRLLRKDEVVAIRLADDALARYPNDPAAHYIRGRIFAARKQRAEAIGEYQKAISGWTLPDTPHAARFLDEMKTYIQRYSD